MAETSKDKTIEDQIREWLHKGGYPLEQSAERAFVCAGFDVRRGVHYDDTDQGRTTRRETDVVAIRSGQLKVPVSAYPDEPAVIDVTLAVVIECKHTPD